MSGYVRILIKELLILVVIETTVMGDFIHIDGYFLVIQFTCDCFEGFVSKGQILKGKLKMVLMKILM